MRQFRDAAAIEEFLVEQMSAQGYLAEDGADGCIVRVIAVTDDGRKIAGTINLTTIALALEDKLS